MVVPVFVPHALLPSPPPAADLPGRRREPRPTRSCTRVERRPFGPTVTEAPAVRTVAPGEQGYHEG